MAAKNAVGNALTGVTGTGNFVGSTSPSLATPTITGLSSVTVATDDKIVLLDTSNSNITAYGTSQSIADLAINTSVPYLYAIRSNASDQSFSSATYTKVQMNSVTVDTNSWFDSSTNYRYTPLWAGKYLVVAAVYVSGSTLAGGRISCAIYKNGSTTGENQTFVPSNGITTLAQAAGIVQMNGSTDYIEIYGRSANGSSLAFANGGTNATFVQIVFLGA